MLLQTSNDAYTLLDEGFSCWFKRNVTARSNSKFVWANTWLASWLQTFGNISSNFPVLESKELGFENVPYYICELGNMEDASCWKSECMWESSNILTGAVTQNGKRMNAPVSISAILSYID